MEFDYLYSPEYVNCILDATNESFEWQLSPFLPKFQYNLKGIKFKNGEVFYFLGEDLEPNKPKAKRLLLCPVMRDKNKH